MFKFVQIISHHPLHHNYVLHLIKLSLQLFCSCEPIFKLTIAILKIIIHCITMLCTLFELTSGEVIQTSRKTSSTCWRHAGHRGRSDIKLAFWEETWVVHAVDVIRKLSYRWKPHFRNFLPFRSLPPMTTCPKRPLPNKRKMNELWPKKEYPFMKVPAKLTYFVQCPLKVNF